MAQEQCTTIVAYAVRSEDIDKFLNAWDRANDYLKEQAGFVSTALHQAASASPQFRFVNVASWESADHFRAATQCSGFWEASAALDAYPLYGAAYDVVRT
jgi:heme-degrading monooxygenase HmoA